MVVCELEIEGQWGLALILDKGSTDSLPELGAQSVVSTRSSILISVVHPQEATARVAISLDDGEREAHLVYSGELRIRSGTLVLCTADGSRSVTATLEPGVYRYDVYADALVQPQRVSVIATRQLA